jgi:hypothetical protein
MSPNPSIKTQFSRRKTAKQLSYRFRHKAISSHEQVEAKKWKRLFYLLLILSFFDKLIGNVYVIPAVKYFSIVLEDSGDSEPVEKPVRKEVSVNSFTPSTAKMFFKFKKQDLSLLIHLVKFPDQCKLDNGSSMSGEEVFLRGLYELCSGDNQQRMCALLFGREQSQHSRAFKYFIEFMNDNYQHLVKDSLPWWHRNGFSKASADAVWDKMLSCEYNPTEAELLTLKRFGYFIDCKCSPTSVVGGGPAEDGVNAARWDIDVNRAFYNGWKSVHGLKHQTGCQVHCRYRKYNTCFLCMAHLACILPSIYALKGGNSAIFFY